MLLPMTTSTTAQSQGSSLGTAIRTLRTTAHLTLADASKLAGISPAYLSRVENGLVSPSPTWVSTVAESIGKHLNDETRTAA